MRKGVQGGEEKSHSTSFVDEKFMYGYHKWDRNRHREEENKEKDKELERTGGYSQDNYSRG